MPYHAHAAARALARATIFPSSSIIPSR
jgi:hypothetical protein